MMVTVTVEDNPVHYVIKLADQVRLIWIKVEPEKNYGNGSSFFENK